MGNQRGFTFLGLLIVFAIMGIGLAAVGPLWHQEQRREKERELLFVGQQYIRAIRQYYESSPGGAKLYPKTLEALLLDDRQLTIRRYLRHLYRDPLTNGNEWGLVLAPEGGIMGVYSLAQGTPIKQSNFPPILGWADNPANYQEWRFVYLPNAPALAPPGAPPVAPASPH